MELDATDIRNSVKRSALLKNPPHPHILALRTFTTPDLWGACTSKHAGHVKLDNLNI